MRRFVIMLLAAGLAGSTLHAQDDGRGRLREAIEERFANQVQEQLGLTDEQASRMRTTARRWFDRRRTLEMEERGLRGALAGQMRPGIQADQDSVARLTDALLALKIAQVQTYRDEMREMTYLTPVQRAQFFILRDRLLRRIEEVQEQGVPPRGRRRP